MAAAAGVQVRETQKTVRDGRTGVESMTLQRGIGDRVSGTGCICVAASASN
jgi:hypothetical protein